VLGFDIVGLRLFETVVLMTTVMFDIDGGRH
jgi:hypothetical protein